MNISELCIRRPVMTTLVMAGLIMFGVMAYFALPVSDLPNVDFPGILVTAALPGATPDTMASSVATPLERQFATIAGIDQMTSTSYQGMTQVVLIFKLSRNIDAAAQDVQAAITKASKQLPPEMPSPPIYQKVNPADQPILYISMSSPTLPPATVDEYAETTLGQRISMIDGVAQVQVFGAQKYAVRAQLDPWALASRGVGINEVSTAIASHNVNLPTGNLDGRYRAFSIQATGQLMHAEDYRPMIVAYRKGAPVRLDDLGRVKDDVENNKTISFYNEPPKGILHRPAVVLAILRQPGTNTVEVVNSVRAILPALKEAIPPSVSLDILFDRSQTIRDSANDVQFTLLLTIALVILVIFLFLRNISATIIPSLALPLSLVGTFAVMYAFAFSLDNFSLLAITLSVGFVVDDAIVMLENIVRHMEQGEKPFEAAVKGSKQISFTILSMTLSLAAVFIPVLFMGGIFGRLLHEFAVTITAAILVSGFVSLTLTPMMCSRFLRHGADARHGKLYAATEAIFNAARDAYGWSLRLVLRRQHATLWAAMVTVPLFLSTLVLTIYMFTKVPKGFLPDEDLSRIFAMTEAAQDISFEDMVRHQQQVGEIIAQDPDVVNFFSGVGMGTTNKGFVFISIKPRAERVGAASINDVIARLTPKLALVPGIKVPLRVPPPLNTGGRMTQAQYQYTLLGPDTGELYRAAGELETRLTGVEGIKDVSSDLQMRLPQVTVAIDRDKAQSLHVSPQAVEDALYSCFGTRQVSTIYAPTNQYQVIVELLPQYQRSPDALNLLYVKSDEGKLVPLPTLVHTVDGVGPLSINHSGQLPAVTLSFNLKPGTALGDAVSAVEKVAHASLPSAVTGSFQGNAQAFQESFGRSLILLGFAVVVIYIILGILYESFIHPLTILSGLPSATLGAMLTLYLFHAELTLYAFVGIIMLIGIVKKNAIMMIDFALEAQRQGNLSPAEAIYQGCLVRFRPIMMTTMAALMGTLPIAIGYGAGAESRKPLGLAVVGGLVVSQLLTLFLTPGIFVCFEAISGLFSGRRRARRSVAPKARTAEPEIDLVVAK